jgi:hypothetical protein
MGLEKQPAQTFDPRSPLWAGKLWVRLVLPQGRYRLHIFWRRLFRLLLVLALAGWLLLTGAVRAVAWQRGVVGVHYIDIALPWRWHDYRATLGRHHWAEAQRAHAEGRTRDVFPLLHAVLREQPANLEARRLMGIYYIRAGYLSFAADCLELGLPAAATDLDYLKLFFGVLDEMQNDERALAVCARLAPAAPTQDLRDLYVALQAATAHFRRGRYDQAEALVAAWGLERSVEGQLLLARCDWERGLRAAAIERLEREEERFSGRDELARELLRFKRENGDGGEWRRQAHLRVLALPDAPGARVDWIASMRATQEADYDQEVARFLREFGRDARALVMLADQAADGGDLELAARVRRAARSADLSSNTFVLAEVQAAINANAPERAFELANEGVKTNREGNPNFLAALAGLRALALYAEGDKERGEIELAVFTDHAGTRAADGVWLARELRRRGADLPTLRLLKTALALDPLNQAALTELVRLVMDLRRYDEARVYLPALLAMRKPSHEVLSEVAFKLEGHPSEMPPGVRARLAEVLASGAGS